MTPLQLALRGIPVAAPYAYFARRQGLSFIHNKLQLTPFKAWRAITTTTPSFLQHSRSYLSSRTSIIVATSGLFVVGMYSVLASSLKEHPAFRQTLILLRNNPRVVDMLGDDIREGWMIEGTTSTLNGIAEFQFTAKGSLSRGRVIASFEREPFVAGISERELKWNAKEVLLVRDDGIYNVVANKDISSSDSASMNIPVSQSTTTLRTIVFFGVAAGIGLGIAAVLSRYGGGKTYTSSAMSSTSNSSFITKAWEVAREHPKLKIALGDSVSITLAQLRTNTGKPVSSKSTIQVVEVPIVGTLGNGKMFAHGYKNSKNEWDLTYLALDVDGRSKRIVLDIHSKKA